MFMAKFNQILVVLTKKTGIKTRMFVVKFDQILFGQLCFKTTTISFDQYIYS